MSYNKLGFVSGQKLKAEHLNHMEEGIANAGGVAPLDVKTIIITRDFTVDEAEAPKISTNITFEEAVEAVNAGCYLDAKEISILDVETCYTHVEDVQYCPLQRDVPYFSLLLTEGNRLYWTSEDISSNMPSGGK